MSSNDTFSIKKFESKTARQESAQVQSLQNIL